MSVRFLHCSHFPPFPYCPLWKKITMRTPHWRNRVLHSTCLSRRSYINYLELFAWKICLFSLLIYSIIYLYQFGLKNIYFILWVITQYFVVQMVPSLPTGSSFRWFLYLFDITPSLWTSLFEHFLNFWYEMIQVHPVYFLPPSPQS